MNPETKQCQNCKNDFVIETEDFVFYEKMKVPPPTWCPDCRLQRRLSFYNLRSLYKRTCDKCQANIISVYDSDTEYIVWCIKCYLSDDWDGKQYAMDYDFSRTFFEQWSELNKKIPKIQLEQVGNNGLGCEYANHTYKSSYVYLSNACVKSEHIAYSAFSRLDKNCADCLHTMENNFCYECVHSNGNYECSFLTNCVQCISSEFLYDCVNCQDCFMSANLRNKRYVFYGKQLNKEEYKTAVEEAKKNALLYDNYKTMMEQAIHRFCESRNVVDSTGNGLVNTKKVFDSFNVNDSENSRFLHLEANKVIDCYDMTSATRTVECYDSLECGRGNSKVFFSYNFGDTQDIQYSQNCNHSHDLFGCVSINNASFCILNKQYSKEEYVEMVEKIKKQMDDMPYVDQKGRIYKYGEFFPSELSPFAYNETAAIEDFPMTKEQTENAGFIWKDNKDKQNKATVSEDFFLEHLYDYNTLENEALPCVQIPGNSLCSKAFRLVSDELLLLKKFHLPIPKYCPNCRYVERRIRQLPNKLWKRKCSNTECENMFQTPYSPDRSERVYCVMCYQQMVL